MIYDHFPHSRMAITWITPAYHHFETILNTLSTSFSNNTRQLHDTSLVLRPCPASGKNIPELDCVQQGGEKKTGSSGKLWVSNQQLVRLGQRLIEYRVWRLPRDNSTSLSFRISCCGTMEQRIAEQWNSKHECLHKTGDFMPRSRYGFVSNLHAVDLFNRLSASVSQLESMAVQLACQACTCRAASSNS